MIYTDDALSPGNAVSLIVEARHLSAVFTALGRPGLPAEEVARAAVSDLRHYLASQVPVVPHLADQLLLPIALAGAGSYQTTRPTSHTRTNMAIIALFTGTRFTSRELSPNRWEISLISAQ